VLADQFRQLLAPFSRQGFGVGYPPDNLPRIQNHGGGYHRSRERTPARLIDAGDKYPVSRAAKHRVSPS